MRFGGHASLCFVAVVSTIWEVSPSESHPDAATPTADGRRCAMGASLLGICTYVWVTPRETVGPAPLRERGVLARWGADPERGPPRHACGSGPAACDGAIMRPGFAHWRGRLAVGLYSARKRRPGLCALERPFARGFVRCLRFPVRKPPPERGRQCTKPAPSKKAVRKPPPEH